VFDAGSNISRTHRHPQPARPSPSLNFRFCPSDNPEAQIVVVALARKGDPADHSSTTAVPLLDQLPRDPKFILGRAMDQVYPPRSEPFSKWVPRHAWQVASIALMGLSVVLFIAVLVSNLQTPKVSIMLLVAMTVAFCIFSLLLANLLLQFRRVETFDITRLCLNRLPTQSPASQNCFPFSVVFRSRPVPSWLL
jgi:NADH:ubiquinone oxidoreductase subunit K